MLSEKPWKLEAVLLLFGAVFLCVTFGTLLCGWLYADAIKAGEMTFGRGVIGVLSFHGAVVVLVFFFVRSHRIRWREAFGLFNGWKCALLLGGASVVIFLPIARGLQWLSLHLLEWLSHPATEQDAVQALRTVNTWQEQLTMIVLMILLVPIAEEILFRGILYPFLKRHGFKRTAVYGVAAFFAAMHFSAAIFIPLFILALLLTFLYERTNNLLAPIAAHSLFNALNFILFYIQKNHG